MRCEVRFAFEVQVVEPEVAAAIIAGLATVLAALIGGFFVVRAARIQASHQRPPELPAPPSPKPGRRRRRPSKRGRSP
jgi:hypothetical protein